MVRIVYFGDEIKNRIDVLEKIEDSILDIISIKGDIIRLI